MAICNDTKQTQLLGHEKISRLLVHYAIPAIVGMLVMSLYNIVDRIYIGQGVGPEAISGLALTFPVMTLSSAFGMLIGAGGAARISILMGKQEKDMAQKVLGNCFVLTIIIAALYSLVNYIWMNPILKAYGATDVTLPYARDYLCIIIPFTILNNMSFGFNNMMRASGYPAKAMITMLISALANVILDPIFIFVFKMGIRGAAVATVISMAITMVWVMLHFTNKKHTITFCKKGFKLNQRVIISIISIGMSPFLINLTAALVNVFFNRTLLSHGGDMAIGAFGIITSFTMMIVMLIIGLCQGMQPIVGYNYGANQPDRVMKTYKTVVIIATAISMIGFLLAMFVPHIIVRGFTKDQNMISMASHGMRLVMSMFPLVGFVIVTTNFFQSLGKAPKAIFLSLSRQVLFLLPMIWLLPRFFELDGVWVASGVADLIAFFISLFMLFRYGRLTKINQGKL